MMYTLDASGTTPAAGQPQPLWPAGSAGTKVRIQNRSLVLLHVQVALPQVAGSPTLPIVIDLPPGVSVDETWVDPTLAVSVASKGDVAVFTAFRMA